MQNSAKLSDNLQPLFVLSLTHISILAISNYLVQIPLTIAGYHITWGTLTFPLIFLTTDLTVRIFGSKLARKIIFVAMLPALILSYVISVLFVDGTWQHFNSLSIFNTFIFRIALASFTAYIVGQLLDIFVFNKLRQNKKWWVAPTCSTFLGNSVDSFIFSVVAFYQCADPFMADNWIEIAILDYAFKLLCCAIFLLPLYGILLNFLQRILQIPNLYATES